MTNENDSMEQPRKASDVLLSIEEKIIAMDKKIAVYDMEHKMILDRVNAIYAYFEQLKQESLEQEENDESSLHIIATSNDYVIPITNEPTKDRRIGRREVPKQAATPASKEQLVQTVMPTKQQEFQPVPMPVQIPQSQQLKIPSSGKKVPVTQQVKDSNGKDMFMADVAITDANNIQVHKTKTNPMGKWQAHLTPGKYYVNIVKTDTASKNKIEAQQEIVIPNSDTAFIIPPVMIKR